MALDVTDPWTVCETTLDHSRNHHAETLFYVGNGYIGMRGTLEEGWLSSDGTEQGTYLSGFYEDCPVVHAEPAVGYNTHESVMLCAPNSRLAAITVEDRESGKILFEVNTFGGVVSNFRRVLDLRTGRLLRSYRWSNSKIDETVALDVTFSRQANLQRKHCALIMVEITTIRLPPNADVVVTWTLDGSVRNRAASNDPRIGSQLSPSSHRVVHTCSDGLVTSTCLSRLTMACMVEHVWSPTTAHVSARVGEAKVEHEFRYSNVSEGSTIAIERHVAYYYEATSLTLDPVISFARVQCQEAAKFGSAHLLAEQDLALKQFWERTDIHVEGDDRVQQALRYNTLSLLMSLGENIGAKGLSGEGYSGHYFWDSEMYVGPVFLFTTPTLTRRILDFRLRTLPMARERALAMSIPTGALYPWRTINGRECSSYYPAGTAQLHINADIAHAVQRYIAATGHESCLYEGLMEVVVETARVYPHVGAWVSRGDETPQFHLHSVTGPDEYNAIVDDNMYTNIMAKEHLLYARTLLLKFEQDRPQSYSEFLSSLKLGTDEIALLQRCADDMYIPCVDPKRRVHPQDAHFLDKALWPKEWKARPLLMHHHPLTIYRHQVCKQADLVLAMMIHPQYFTPEQMKSNFEYYEAVTTHDSSLSECIFSIVASKLNYEKKAYSYFENTCRIDLDDLHGNTKHGIHAACMAGSWMCVIHGFGGVHLDIRSGELHLDPQIPAHWTSYAFRLTIRDSVLRVRVAQGHVFYELVEGLSVSFRHRQVLVHLHERRQVRATFGLVLDPVYAGRAIRVSPVLYTGETHARGIVAQEDIPRGTLIEESPCVAFNPGEYNEHIRCTVLEHYVYTSSGGMLLALGLGSIFNHSPYPTVDYRIDETNLVIRYYTFREVAAGEELTIFYGQHVKF